MERVEIRERTELRERAVADERTDRFERAAGARSTPGRCVKGSTGGVLPNDQTQIEKPKGGRRIARGFASSGWLLACECD